MCNYIGILHFITNKKSQNKLIYQTIRSVACNNKQKSNNYKKIIKLI